MADVAISNMIGPEHDGQPMSLDEFALVDGRPNYIYELERGVIQVTNIPNLPHGMIVQVIRDAFVIYKASHPGSIYYIATGADAVIRLPGMQSERHPDLLVYFSTPPHDDPKPWEYWIPDIVFEVVSDGSEHRDYITKRDEYLAAGVHIYCIVDPAQANVTVLTRHADVWRSRTLTATDVLMTSLLKDFALPVADVFSAGRRK